MHPGNQVARYGGEEFLLLLPDTHHQDAIAEQPHQTVLDREIEHRTSRTSGFSTASIGVATIRPSHSETISRLKREADALLYCAKRYGRNRIGAREIE
jgi:diguanylate cyclase (GGDEF)-like protein